MPARLGARPPSGHPQPGAMSPWIALWEPELECPAPETKMSPLATCQEERRSLSKPGEVDPYSFRTSSVEQQDVLNRLGIRPVRASGSATNGDLLALTVKRHQRGHHGLALRGRGIEHPSSRHGVTSRCRGSASRHVEKKPALLDANTGYGAARSGRSTASARAAGQGQSQSHS